MSDLKFTVNATKQVCTYVVDGAIVAAQEEEGPCCVTAGYGNNVLNLKEVSHQPEYSVTTG